MRGDTLDIGCIAPQPDHSENRYERERCDEAAKAGASPRDLGHKHDDDPRECCLENEISHAQPLIGFPRVRHGRGIDVALVAAVATIHPHLAIIRHIADGDRCGHLILE